MTRAVSGLSFEAMACASSSRPLPCVNGAGFPRASTVMNRRRTASPGAPGFPRLNTRGSTSGPSAIAIARGGESGPAFSASIFFDNSRE